VAEVKDKVSSSIEADSYLRDVDLEILRVLGDQVESTIAFQGLRRRMNIHQEKLSRALQRLEQDDLVARTPGGYTITPKGSQIVDRWVPRATGGLETLLEAYLPADVSPGFVASRLRGRWFGSLRWLGQAEAPGKMVLRWVTEETGVEVRVTLTWGHLVVETDAESGPGHRDAFQATQEIFAHLGPMGPTQDVPQLFVT
jgi:DNA-binding MarR family transcriptional regulator